MSDLQEALRDLIREHGPHGFDGIMRARTDGCPIFVAAVALDEALLAAKCPLSPAAGRSESPTQPDVRSTRDAD